MEEMKKDEVLEEQQMAAEAAEATEAEAVQAEEIPDAVDETAEKIAKLEQQAADNLDKYQRTLAEFDNFRKRTIKEKAVMYDDGVRSTIEKLLTVIDNLERAVAVQEGKVDADDAFFKGVKMTLVQFQNDFVFTITFVILMRNCRVQVGVEFLAQCLDFLHAHAVQDFPELHQSHFHALEESIVRIDLSFLYAAVAHEDDESYGENEVILEMLKGYKYKDKVIRHSMVKVAN